MIKLKKIQRGFGLLELMLSMVIVALLLIMATRYYQSAHRAQRVSDAVTGVNAIIGAANEFAISSGGYSGITDITTIQNLLPDSANGNLDPWGIAYTAVGAAGTAGAASTLTVTVPTGGDAKGCSALQNALTNIDGVAVTPCSTGGVLSLLVSYDGKNAAG